MMRAAFVTLGIVCAVGCALGDPGPEGGSNDGNVWKPGESGTSVGMDDDDDSPADNPADDAADGADGGPEGCEFGCNNPPGDCFSPDGACENEVCVYSPVLAGEPCTDDCVGGGFCDASGGCICTGGDDSGGMSDTGGTNPDDCMMTCTAGPNANASCNAMGECIVTCTAPYEDCDGDPGNGCEIPVGVAHACDAGGINEAGGCWTAYCGAGPGGAGVTSFGSFHCVDCATCEQPSAGNCHWCNHTTGNWYPTEACSCGAQYLGAVCS
jgi:hypothetical protein